MHVTKENFNLDVLAVTGQATGHPTWLVPTWIIRQLRYDTRLSSAVDHNLATRTALLGLGWTHVGKAVVLRRIHDGQVSNVDSKNQKLGAWLTRQFAVSGLRADIEYSARERVKEHHPWVQVKERADLARAFTKYLPGQNWLKAIVISGPLASKLGILTNYEEAVTLCAELDSDGKVVRERAWLYEPDIQSLAALVAHGYTFEAVIADSQEALSHAAEKWVTRSLTGAHRSMDTSVVLVGKVDRCPDLSELGGSAFYLRDLEGRETWTVAVPVQESEQINQAIRDFGIAVPAVMASKSVEMTELMAMIGAELE